MLSATHSITTTVLLASLLAQQTMTLVSVDSSGVQSNYESQVQALSADGRFVAFWSGASNLVAGDTNNTADIFVRDLENDVTTRVSVGAAGAQSNGASGRMALSSDGRYVGFESVATNLVTGDSNGVNDVFVHDRQNAVTIRVSVAGFGAEATGQSIEPSLSADGRYVAFSSIATNLVGADFNASADVFVRDLQANTTERVSVDSADGEGFGNSLDPSISADGRYVAFVSSAPNLVLSDFNLRDDVFVHDRALGMTTRVSVDSAGVEGDGVSWEPALSGNGRYVVFTSRARNLTPGIGFFPQNTFVHDRVAGATTLLSGTPSGTSANGWSFGPTISWDGRFVAFVSNATDLVPGNIPSDNLFLRDHATGSMVRLTNGPSGTPLTVGSYRPSISDDGRRIVFDSRSELLVVGDTNHRSDVFLCELSLAPAPYCTSATTTNGCTPSISSTGTPSASATSGFTIAVSSVEGQRNGLIFYGLSGPVALPWASGSTSFMCVKSPTQRTPAQISGGTTSSCNGSLALDFLAFVAANPGVLGQPLVAGTRVNAQAWMRDPPAPKTTNLSNALSFDVVP